VTQAGLYSRSPAQGDKNEEDAVGPVEAGIPCGNDPNAFEVFDSGIESQVAIRYYDGNGNLTRHDCQARAFHGRWRLLQATTQPYE
jgi:hypothetical protein